MKSSKTLGPEGKQFYEKVLSEFELADTHDLERLFQACRCLDEIEESETVLKAEGRFIADRFQQCREHPAGKVIRDNKTLFCRIIRELCLDLAVSDDPRPPRQY